MRKNAQVKQSPVQERTELYLEDTQRDWFYPNTVLQGEKKKRQGKMDSIQIVQAYEYQAKKTIYLNNY